MKHYISKKNKWEDHYSIKAKKEGFPARSVYKLQEIQRKYNIIKKKQKILDLGCAPGSWLLYAADLTGARGDVVGIDVQKVKIRFPSNVQVIKGDLLSLTVKQNELVGTDFDVVLSDMSPALSGNKHVDNANSLRLCNAALDISQNVLVSGGVFVCKTFQGEDFCCFLDSVKAVFEKYKIFKPQSSRKASREIYIIGKKKKTGGMYYVGA